MRLLLVCSVVAAWASLAAAQNYFQPQPSGPPRGAPPPPQRTGPVGFTGIPLARFPSLDSSHAPPPPHAFRAATPVVDHDDDDDDALARNIVTPSPSPLFVSRPPQPSPTPVYRRPAQAAQQPIPARVQQPQQSQRRPTPQRGGPYQQQVQDEPLEEEELEEEKPDKLSLLLPQSKFDCHSRKTGYYADDGLNCEVFHYCQDNVRHSWICPEGFLFHQVHLICMPPSGDNICKQSSNFHFVNDYLYRPINAEEAQTKPNVTLRYSDRYYPDNYYEEGEERPQRPVQHVAAAAPAPPPPRGRPGQQVLYRQPGPNQVFHSPEEVNIPLVQRRPVPNNQRAYHAPPPQQQQQHQQQQQQQQHEDDFEYDDAPFRG